MVVLEFVAVDTVVGREGGTRSPVVCVAVVLGMVCVDVDSMTVELTVTVIVKTRIPELLASTATRRKEIFR